jgi:hypothetical protein
MRKSDRARAAATILALRLLQLRALGGQGDRIAFLVALFNTNNRRHV